MARRKEPKIPDAILDQLLAGLIRRRPLTRMAFWTI